MLRIAIFLAVTLVWAHAFEPMPMPKSGISGAGGDKMAFKIMLSKKPQELDPNVCVVVGSIYANGDQELGVKKNIDKGMAYMQRASDQNISMGMLLLANAYAEKDNYTGFYEQMTRLYKADDQKLSVPAGLTLAGIYASQDMYEQSFSALLYVAQKYGDSRAQFLAGYSIVSGTYAPSYMNKRDGEFLIYQACTNEERDPSLADKCLVYNIN